MYGGKITTGGKAWKHNCSCRVMFAKGDYLDEVGNELKKSCDAPAGNRVMVSIVKTKVDKPDRKTGFYTLMYDTGIDDITDLIDVAMKYGYINKAGSWFTFCDIETGEIITDEQGNEIKIQGLVGVIDYVKNNKIMLDELREKLIGK